MVRDLREEDGGRQKKRHGNNAATMLLPPPLKYTDSLDKVHSSKYGI